MNTLIKVLLPSTFLFLSFSFNNHAEASDFDFDVPIIDLVESGKYRKPLPPKGIPADHPISYLLDCWERVDDKEALAFTSAGYPLYKQKSLDHFEEINAGLYYEGSETPQCSFTMRERRNTSDSFSTRFLQQGMYVINLEKRQGELMNELKNHME